MAGCSKIFLSFSALLNNPTYKQILTILKRKDIKAELAFICSSARLFTSFMELFQSSRPLIHIMCDEIHRLTTAMIMKISIQSSVENLGGCEEVLQSEHLLPVKLIIFNDEILSEIAHLDYDTISNHNIQIHD